MEKLKQDLKRILDREAFLDNEISIIQEDLQKAIENGNDNDKLSYEQYLSELKEEKDQISVKKSNLIEELKNKRAKENQKKSRWHPKLTQEQIDELKAEGIEPGDPEYTLSLYNYGIKPEKSEVIDKKTEDVNRYRKELEYLKSLLDDPDLDPSDMPDQNRQEILNRIAELEEKLKGKGSQDRSDDGKAEDVNRYRKELEYLKSLLDDPDLDPSDMPDQNRQEILNRIAELEEKLKGKEPQDRSDDGKNPGDDGKNPGDDGKNPGDDGKNPGDDGKNPGDDGKGPGTRSNLPIRSFWEIYDSTYTQHVGSIANAINKTAHMKILPSKDEDTLQKVLNVGLIPFKAAMKLASFIPNKILGTDRKLAEMQENIDELSVEDFQVLVQSPEKVNEMFGAHIKDRFDRDYLDPQFMKHYKVNNAYLDVVRSRLGRERGEAINLYNQNAINAEIRMRELEEVGEENWTPEQEIEYRNSVGIYQKCVAEGKKLQAELDSFDEGAKKKSSSYRNISGWLLAKFNPDNREQNAEMAELSKARREAAQIGDATRVSSITGKMQRKAREHTKLRGGRKNYIDIGAYSMEGPIETLDRGPQNKGRLLLSNVAIISSAMGLANQVKENIANRQMVETHNQQLGQVNQANQNIQVSGQAKVSGSQSAEQAQEAITRQTVNAGFNQAERANLEANGFSFGGNYHKNDITVHADATRAATDAENLLKQGDNLGALKTATNYYTKVQRDSQASVANYMASHPQHDYTAYSFGSTADMSKVVDFFVNGTVPYQTNINGALAGLMPSLKEGIDINAAIFVGANALYQAQKEGTKDMRKQLRRNARRNNVEIQNEEPQNDNNEQNNRGNQDDGREEI